MINLWFVLLRSDRKGATKGNTQAFDFKDNIQNNQEVRGIFRTEHRAG